MRKVTRILTLALCLVMILSCVLTSSAAVYTKTTAQYSSCRAHSNCMYVSFRSQGNSSTGVIYDKYFSSNSSHWPNAYRYDNVWSYRIGNTGYAKGTYTLYSSIVTQWMSLAFKSSSRTIVHTY